MPLAITTDPTSDPTSYDMLAPHQGADGPLHRFHNRRHACPHQGAGGPLHRCHNRCLCFLHRRRDDVCEVDAGVA